jgi:hypothetical protein
LKWTPAMVDAMTFAEFYATVKGYMRAQGGPSPEAAPPTEEEYLRVLMEEQVAGRA